MDTASSSPPAAMLLTPSALTSEILRNSKTGSGPSQGSGGDSCDLSDYVRQELELVLRTSDREALTTALLEKRADSKDATGDAPSTVKGDETSSVTNEGRACVEKELEQKRESAGDARVVDVGELTSDETERWLVWARSKRSLKEISVAVPEDILPPGYRATLHDVRVLAKHGPDDAIYDANEEFRQKVARGNCVLELVDTEGKVTFKFVIFALKKFTGGLGDDDDRDCGDNLTWQKYFTKPLEDTHQVICLKKANGEAAHVNAFWMKGTFYICCGSKNVHLLLRAKDDIDKYEGDRYQIAKDVSHAVMNLLDNMEDSVRTRFLSFLHHTSYTAVFEILQPHYQHVVNLSYLKKSQLCFITWTCSSMIRDEALCVLPPHVSLEIASALSLHAVDYDTTGLEGVEDYMSKIRTGYSYEGQVLYFLDSGGTVIGLLKKKTVWYIMVRAIREKVRQAARDFVKNSFTFTVPPYVQKLEKRVGEIQAWLGLEDNTTSRWKKLGGSFEQWVIKKFESGDLSSKDVFDHFPITWQSFLDDTGATDHIEVCLKEKLPV